MLQLTTESISKFIVDDIIDYPSADISFNWQSSASGELNLLIHFSRVIDGSTKDLNLTFKQPLAIQWETESFGLIDTPKEIPKCTNPKFSDWNYPLLIIENSKWADKYASSLYTEDEYKTHSVIHYFFISMNDLFHVLSTECPIASWVVSIDA